MIHVHVSAQCLFLSHHLPKTHVFSNVFYERADIPLQIPSLQSLSLFFFLDVDVSQAGQQLWGHRWHVAWCKIRTHQPARTESGQAGPQVLLNSSETSPPPHNVKHCDGQLHQPSEWHETALPYLP